MRLLPIVLFAASALFLLKVIGLATGVGSFAVGPATAVAAGGGEHEGAPAPAQSADPSMEELMLGPPVDLAAEAEALAKQKASAGEHGAPEGEHAAPAEGEHAAPAEGEHATPAEGEHAAPAEGEHAAAPEGEHAAPAEGEHAAPAEGEHAAPAEGEHAAPAEGEHAAAPEGEHAAPAEGEHAAAPEGEHAAAPAGDHAAPAAGEHGEAPAEGEIPASTVRPAEYKPVDETAERAVLESLAERRKSLEQREDDINLRMKLLEAAEQKMQSRLDELKALEEQLKAQAPEPPEVEAEKVKNLVSMYENMKPKAAAQVFNTLDMPVLLALVRQMNPRKMAPILASMDPERAGQLTIQLAGSQEAKEIVVRRVDPGDLPQPAADDLPKIMPADPAPGG